MFTVRPEDIQHFTDKQLVGLLRVLVYAEARKAGVALRNVDVPLQITIADGGQDATVRWEDGEASTDYFPGRDLVFQCKATDHGDAQWEREVWTKKTQRKTIKKKELSEAIAGVLDRGATYIGVTATPLVGTKANDRIAAIKKGITAAGGDPSKIKVHVYEGNTLAAWASQHPVAAIWVNEQRPGRELAGFHTLDQWGKRADLASPPFVATSDRTFTIGRDAANVINFSQLAARLVDDLTELRACARLWGASGIGKTRALYQALHETSGELKGLTVANFIFCDMREVSLQIWDVANHIAKERSAAVLVVDGCTAAEARRLNSIARTEHSQLRIVTIGADPLEGDTLCQLIRPNPAGLDTIRGILRAALPTAKNDEIDYLARLCDGFPRIAVLATQSYQRMDILKSADDVAEQIIDAARIDRDTVRALEGLSLFEELAPDDNPAGFDTIANSLVHMKGELMYENLVIAASHHLVSRSYGNMAAQPQPIADYLALRRLDYLRPSTVAKFLEDASDTHRDAMLRRWRQLARSRTLGDVVRGLLRTKFGTAAALLDEETGPYLAAFVHVATDTTGNELFFAITQMPIANLATVPVTDGLMDALRLLASRESSFVGAARMVLSLVAASSFEPSLPILQLLRQLFQVALAGTQANDRLRREALNLALEDNDPSMRRACVEALGAMLQTHVSRSGGFEPVGAEPYRREWYPADQATISAYFNWALERLLELWRTTPDLRPVIEDHVARDLRNLLGPASLAIIETFVNEVVAASGHWFEATKSIGDWLYFDRPAQADTFTGQVRAVYDATLPTEPVEQALLYSRFWAADIHDPDKRYADNAHDPDFEYSARCAAALAPSIAADPDQLARVITAMATEEMNAPYAFAEALAPYLPDPLDAFRRAVNALDASGTRTGMTFVRSLLSVIDRQLADQPDKVAELEAIANASPAFASSQMNLYTALRTTDERLARLTKQIRDGEIEPRQVVSISYGRGLAETGPTALADLVEALVERDDAGGGSAALEILSMVTHGWEKLSPEIIPLAKLAILAPSIAEDDDAGADNAEYVYERMIRLLATSGAIDDLFARAFALQIEQACRSGARRRARPSDALRAALATVIDAAPNEVWAVLAGFYEIGTRVERERLNGIVSANKLFAYDVSRTGAGALYQTPIELMLDWVKKDPDARIAFLVSFFPILVQQEQGWVWHPDLQRLADLYGASKAFQAALRVRIFPSSWGGSLNAHFTSFIAPLEAWEGNGPLSEWASGVLDAIKRALEDEFYSR